MDLKQQLIDRVDVCEFIDIMNITVEDLVDKFEEEIEQNKPAFYFLDLGEEYED